MYCYQNNPELHSTNTITKITQTYNYNTWLTSKNYYVLPNKRTEFGKN